MSFSFETFPPQIIRDRNISDRQCLAVLTVLRKHWKQGVPKYVQKALFDKKRQLDHLYSKVGNILNVLERLSG